MLIKTVGCEKDIIELLCWRTYASVNYVNPESFGSNFNGSLVLQFRTESDWLRMYLVS